MCGIAENIKRAPEAPAVVIWTALWKKSAVIKNMRLNGAVAEIKIMYLFLYFLPNEKEFGFKLPSGCCIG